MWKRLRWQYTQRKLLFLPLSPAFQWALRGLFEEWVFGYLTRYTEARVGWVVNLIEWAISHPNLSTGILVFIIALIIAVWAIRDARKKNEELYGMEDILDKRFTLLLDHADTRAKEIKVDNDFRGTMKKIAEEILFVNTEKYKGKDFKTKKIQQSIGNEIIKEVKSDNESERYFSLIASALDNDGYGLSKIENNNQHIKLLDKLKKLRRVPSQKINDAINKCMEHSYSLASGYLFHAICLNNKLAIGANILASYQTYNRKQRDGTGGMSLCLTELRIEIDNFLHGGKDNG